MPRPPIAAFFTTHPCRQPIWTITFTLCGSVAAFVAAGQLTGQQVSPSEVEQPATSLPSKSRGEGQVAGQSTNRQAKLEAALVKMLSGATLEGSFTSTGADRDPTKLSREKYTLGNVQKLAGKFWLIPARIEYGEHDMTLPITVPIEWAGDTPLVVIDNLPLPVFGTVSARVMFFADHYAGYWKHGDHGGHLFGVIRRGDEPPAAANAPVAEKPSVDESPAGEKPQDQAGQR